MLRTAILPGTIVFAAGLVSAAELVAQEPVGPPLEEPTVSVLQGAPGSSLQDTTEVRVPERIDQTRLDLRLATRSSSRSSTSPGGVVKTTEAGGLLPSLGFAHWLNENLAFIGTAAVHGARVEESNTGNGGWETTRAFSVPILMGLRRSILPSGKDARLQPWASAEAGPMVGVEITTADDPYGGRSKRAVGTRFALAARGAAGLDIPLSQRLTVSGSAGYLLIPGLGDAAEDQSNHGGLDVGIGFGILLR